VSHIVGCPRRSQQRLRRHAAVVQAIAPHQFAFNQRDLRAQGGSTRCGDESYGPCTDDDHVVSRRGLRIGPIAGMQIRTQHLAVLVIGQ